MKNTVYTLVCVLLLVLLAQGGAFAKPPESRGGQRGPVSGISLAPSPLTIDFVTHNWGNLRTTVDNHGYVGGRYFYDEPSGEWPRNSGHHHLAEIMYWMGATLPNGDTLVANTWDDFQVVTPLGAAENRILLSTDTSRYYAYDENDTVGLGLGSPARGWRVWNADSSAWVYNQVYDPMADDFFPAGPTSLQESHYRFNDVAEGSPLLGLEITHTVLQWNYCYNEDFLFMILEITNNSVYDYTDFNFGIYCDFDIGGPDGTGENGRLGDLVAYDTLENLAWTYDEDGYDEGWASETGVMGTKYLETPDDIGMTALRTGDWALVPDYDEGRYALIDEQTYDTPLPPTDQYYIQCTRGINLTAGKTVRVVYALVAGEDEEDFRANADLAQQLYDNNFVGPQPPATPELTVKAGDRKVYLSWTDTSEVSSDPLSGENDFVGYKLYRSGDRGVTWGKEIDGRDIFSDCLEHDYKTIGSWWVRNPGEPIPHSFVDTDLYNDMEYWYCLVAYDAGDTITGVDILQTGFGVAGEVSNVVSVRPRNDPAGYYDAAATVEHEYNGLEEPSEGDVMPIVFNEDQVGSYEYQVAFEDVLDEDTYWHLINNTTGDTVLANQTNSDLDPGMFDIVEGLRVVLRNGHREPRSMDQTAFGGADTTLIVSDFYGPPLVTLYGGDTTQHWSEAPYRSDYEIRFTADSTFAPSLLEFVGDPATFWLPFEVWNTTRDERVSATVYDFPGPYAGVWDGGDLLCLVDYPYDPANDLLTDAFPYLFSWFFGFDTLAYAPVEGDVYTFEEAPLNGPDDVFTFEVDGIYAAAATAELEDIRVVPDPYFATSDERSETEGSPRLRFTGVPENCSIRIYTIGGDLVQTLVKTGSGGEIEWDLLSSNLQQIASGIYLYHVESPYGEHLGRFAVIK